MTTADERSAREFKEARARGSIQPWPIAEDYTIRDGRLIQVGDSSRGHWYYPLAYPELVGGFARLESNDETAVVEFARRWGLLGPLRIAAVTPENKLAGDPLNWIWAHSEQVRDVLDALQILRLNDDVRLCKLVSKWKDQDGNLPESIQVKTVDARETAGVPYEFPLMGYIVEGVHIEVPPFSAPAADTRGRWTEDHEFTASAIQEIINTNIGTSAPRLERYGKHLFTLSCSYGCLLEAIYSHLADVAIGQRSFLRCEFCDNFFEQKDKRQRYCPPVGGAKESLCSRRGRKQRHLEKTSQVSS